MKTLAALVVVFASSLGTIVSAGGPYVGCRQWSYACDTCYAACPCHPPCAVEYTALGTCCCGWEPIECPPEKAGAPVPTRYSGPGRGGYMILQTKDGQLLGLNPDGKVFKLVNGSWAPYPSQNQNQIPQQ